HSLALHDALPICDPRRDLQLTCGQAETRGFLMWRMRPTPQPREVRLQEVEHEPVALGEVGRAGRTVEEKRLRVPERRWKRDVQLVLYAHRPEPQRVDPASTQTAERDEVGQLVGVEHSGAVDSADRMLVR